MKVLVVGGGGREHALVWKLAQSPKVTEIFAAPGNPGLAGAATLWPLEAEDISGLTQAAVEAKIDLVVVGPEAPLALGLADKMAAAGLKVFGPGQVGAGLESSKSFAKSFMARHNIPTAAYARFDQVEKAVEYLRSKPEGPIVVKADGLAQGKGVTVAASLAEAEQAVREALEDFRFGQAGAEVVIEDFIDGEEVTILAFCDGKTLVTMPPVQDHKRVGEGDTGPNTGGMGAYSPVAVYTPEVAKIARETIFEPTLAGLRAEGIDYCGCLYFGLILPSARSTYQGPQVIEYNARFGDPETEVVMMLLQSDLADIFLHCTEGRLGEMEVGWHGGAAACVVMVSGGYPGSYPTGYPISGLAEGGLKASGSSSLAVFQAGTAARDGEIVTHGGRVLAVSALAENLEGALAQVYQRIDNLKFEGSYYRRDIGHRELARRKK